MNVAKITIGSDPQRTLFDGNVLDYLREHYPNGFNVATAMYADGQRIDFNEDDDYYLEPKNLVIVETPEIAAALGITSIFWATIVDFIAISALSYLVGLIFSPVQAGTLSDPNDNSRKVYDISSSQNTAGINSPMPIAYGTIRICPLLISKPYFYFYQNEEYMIQLMYVSENEVSAAGITPILAGTENPDYGDDVFKCVHLTWDEIKNGAAPHNMRTHFHGYNSVLKYVNELSNYELTHASPTNVFHAPGTISKGMTDTSGNALDFIMYRIAIDFYWPQGIYHMSSEGKYQGLNYYYKADVSWVVTKDGTDETIHSNHEWRKYGKSNKYRRDTRWLSITKAVVDKLDAGYTLKDVSFKVTQTTEDWESARYMDQTIIVRAKWLYGYRVPGSRAIHSFDYYNTQEFPQGFSVYMVRMKASNAISAYASTRISLDVNMEKKTMKDTIDDIYTKSGLDPSNLIYDGCADLPVNCYMTNKLTVKDAIDAVARPQSCYAFPYFDKLIIKKDQARDVVYTFNESNIIKGSLVWNWNFTNPRPVSVSFYNKDDGYKEKTLYKPEWQSEYKNVKLLGVTDTTTASTNLDLFYNHQLDDQVVTFTTDQRGYIPMYLDVIELSVDMVTNSLTGYCFRGNYDEANFVFVPDPNGEYIYTSCDYDLYPIQYNETPLHCDKPIHCDLPLTCDAGAPRAGDDWNTYDKITFTKPTGTQTDVFTFEHVYHNGVGVRHLIKVTGLPTWLDNSYNQVFTIGDIYKRTRNFTITNIEIDGAAFKISAKKYNDIY